MSKQNKKQWKEEKNIPIIWMSVQKQIWYRYAMWYMCHCWLFLFIAFAFACARVRIHTHNSALIVPNKIGSEVNSKTDNDHPIIIQVTNANVNKDLKLSLKKIALHRKFYDYFDCPLWGLRVLKGSEIWTAKKFLQKRTKYCELTHSCTRRT